MSDSESPTSADILDAVVSKKSRGRPRKVKAASAISGVTITDIQSLFRDIEKKLSSALSDLVSEALAPLRLFVKDQVKSMNDRLATLEEQFRERLDQLNDEVDQLRRHTSATTYAAAAAQPVPEHASSNPPTKPPIAHTTRSNALRTDRNLNLVIYGIQECNKGTPRHVRSADDLESVTSTLASVDASLNDFSIRDCFRLGKYNEIARTPRPILAKFNRATDVSNILSKRSSLPQSIVVKPDMTPEQRSQEAVLLKERWLQMQSGVPKQSIKIRYDKLYINNRPHGQVINSVYHKLPLLSDLAPEINKISDASSPSVVQGVNSSGSN